MKRNRVLIIALFLSLGIFARTQNLLSSRYTVEDLQRRLIPRSEWTPFPRLDDRESWAKADTAMIHSCIRFAEANIDYDWPVVPATLSLLIVRTGDRHEYQKVSYRKRIVLATLIEAELAENKGRFIDPIINGIWSICEESWWGAAAHLPRGKEYSGLMDVTNPFVDLYAGATAGVLAWADYFLGEKFDEVSPQIRKRIRHEIDYRILTPLRTKHHDWMGTEEADGTPNNWNPWICSNWLTAVLLMEDEDTRRAQTVAQILKTLDAFMNHYPEDGGCSEGPGYWGAAFGALYDNILLLNLATNNAFNYVYENEKFRNMARFIYRVQISENYAVNFADAPPWMGGVTNFGYRIGKSIQDENMMRLAAYYRSSTFSPDFVRSHFARDFFDFFIQDEIRNAPQGLVLPQDVWFPDLEVAIARDRGGSSKGFFLAAKGGNNAESHNHNDIGNFIVYYDGRPLLLDVGSPRYTAMTFTERRYEIWNLCSDYHNTPTINGVTQKAGKDFRASGARFGKKAASSEFSLDLAGAYPEEAAVKSWKRTVTLNRGKNL
ncbi:MAG: heparinase II/III-family protein, partial [Dysgonamonadaceae bacterium]|nr:heparinase II/III-family protein [Dysgonamonadaceae bacterium]